MTHAGGVVPSSMHRRRYAAVSTRTGSCAGRVLGAARMSSARLEPPSVAPLSGGLDVEALVGWTAPSAPAASCRSSSGSGSSSSPSLGSSSSLAANAAKALAGAGGVGSRGVADLRAFPRLFFERVPERGISVSHGGHQYGKLVSSRKRYVSLRGSSSKCRGRYSSRSWRRSGRCRRGAGVEAEVPCRSSSQPTRLSGFLS